MEKSSTISPMAVPILDTRAQLMDTLGMGDEVTRELSNLATKFRQVQVVS